MYYIGNLREELLEILFTEYEINDVPQFRFQLCEKINSTSGFLSVLNHKTFSRLH